MWQRGRRLEKSPEEPPGAKPLGTSQQETYNWDSAALQWKHTRNSDRLLFFSFPNCCEAWKTLFPSSVILAACVVTVP